MIKAALFDFGGVLTSSPFAVFAAHERERGLPEGFLRRLNATNPDANAWAQLERAEISAGEFAGLFEAEARAAGGEVDAALLLGSLAGEPLPVMIAAVACCKERLRTALLTNNWIGRDRTFLDAFGEAREISALFDVVVQSAVVGVRKPDARFYEMACAQLSVAPAECVFLDDLGVNLKTARHMGMTTIKVVDHATALAELEEVVGFPLA